MIWLDVSSVCLVTVSIKSTKSWRGHLQERYHRCERVRVAQTGRCLLKTLIALCLSGSEPS